MTELVASSRDALVGYFHEARRCVDGGCMHASNWRQCEARADALLASGVVRVLPDEETLLAAFDARAEFRCPCQGYAGERHDVNPPCIQRRLARAVLALFTEGDKG